MVELSISHILARARVFAKEYPALWRMAREVGLSTKGKVSTPETDLCIEGFESSSNSFVLNVVRHLTGPVQIAHHCHTVSSVKMALQNDVDTLILFRDPRDAIASTAVRFRPSIRECVIGYVSFYEYINGIKDKVTLISFEEATRETEKMVSKIRRQVRIKVREVDDVDKMEEEVKEKMVEWQRKNSSMETIPLPKSRRDEKKEQLRHHLDTRNDFQEARAVYQKIQSAYRRQEARLGHAQAP